SDGGAILPAAAARVLSHGYAELDAPFPKRLVVIRAVEGDGVAVPGRFLPIDSLRRAWDLSLLVSPQHDRFETTLLDHIFQLLKGFIRCLGRDNSNRRKPCGVRREHVGGHHVASAACGQGHLILPDALVSESN